LGQKLTQNRNKGDSLTFYHPATGRYYRASQLAKRHRVTPQAIRKRRRDGWSDAEIIAGVRLPKPLPGPKPKRQQTVSELLAMSDYYQKAARQLRYDQDHPPGPISQIKFTSDPVPKPKQASALEPTVAPPVQDKLTWAEIWADPDDE
jgi:hypothetical protein